MGDKLSELISTHIEGPKLTGVIHALQIFIREQWLCSSQKVDRKSLSSWKHFKMKVFVFLAVLDKNAVQEQIAQYPGLTVIGDYNVSHHL